MGCPHFPLPHFLTAKEENEIDDNCNKKQTKGKSQIERFMGDISASLPSLAHTPPLLVCDGNTGEGGLDEPSQWTTT